MRKRVAIALVIACVLIPFVFAGGQKEPQAKGKIVIGVCMVTFNSPYATAMVKEWPRYCEEKGYGLVLLDSELNVQKEAQNMDTLIGKKVDVIAIVPVDAQGSRAAIKKAVDAKIPVICNNVTVDSPEEIGVRAFAGPSSYLQAQVAAREAIKRKPDANVVMITGTPGYSAAIERETGFTDTIKKEAPKMKMLDIQTGDWMREDTQRVMSDYITKYGKKIQIVYCHDDNMTVGAINALKAAGYTKDNRPIIVSCTAMPDGMEAIK
jgi:ribose transport system substrate-binding protein